MTFRNSFEVPIWKKNHRGSNQVNEEAMRRLPTRTSGYQGTYYIAK